MKAKGNRTKWRLILSTTLIAGTLDLMAASTQAWITSHITPKQLLAFIASGIWGEAAYTGGYEIQLVGLVVHFIIVFTIVICFFWLYPRIPFLRQSILLNAVLIGVLAWVVTTQLVVRLSAIPPSEFHWIPTLIAIGILIVCIGLPIAIGARKLKTHRIF